MPRSTTKTLASSSEGSAATGPIWPTPCRPCAGRMIRNPGHICRGQGEKSAKCAHCVAGHHRCEDWFHKPKRKSLPFETSQHSDRLGDKDGKIRPAARAVAAASLKILRGEKVADYAALATKYNFLARREAKRRAPAAGASAPTAASTDMLTGLMQRQNEILLDIKAELTALREKFGVDTPPMEDVDDQEDDFGFERGREEEDQDNKDEG